MKTTISIPDILFENADETAKKLSLTRSELCQRAIEKYVNEFNEDMLMENLNQTYGKQDSRLDQSLENMQAETIGKATQNDSW